MIESSEFSIENLLRFYDCKRRGELFVEEPRTYKVICDGTDCSHEVGPYRAEAIAILVAIVDGWTLRVRTRTFSGITHHDYCPTCKKRYAL